MSASGRDADAQRMAAFAQKPGTRYEDHLLHLAGPGFRDNCVFPVSHLGAERRYCIGACMVDAQRRMFAFWRRVMTPASVSSLVNCDTHFKNGP